MSAQLRNMKSTTIAIRISQELKEKLDEEAMKKKMSVSKFIRQLIENTVEGNSLQEIENRLKALESNTIIKGENVHQHRLTMAYAHILSSVPGISINDAILHTKNVLVGLNINPTEITKLSRPEYEELALQFQKQIISDFDLSNEVSLLTEAIMLCAISELYSSDIFQPYGISLDIIQQLKSTK